MNLASAKSNDPSRCRHFTANGRRCRLPVLDHSSHLCFRHSSLNAAASHPHNDSEDLSTDLLPELSESNSGVNIRQFLARLLVLVTQGRVSVRRASVLGYLANQLLHSNISGSTKSARRSDLNDWHNSVCSLLEGDRPVPHSSHPRRIPSQAVTPDAAAGICEREKTSS